MQRGRDIHLKSHSVVSQAPYNGMHTAREGRVTRLSTQMQQQQQMQQPPPDPAFYNDPRQPNPQWIHNQNYGHGSQQQFFNHVGDGDGDEPMDGGVF